MSRAQDKAGTKAYWRKGLSKQYGKQAVKHWRDKSNARKKP